MNQGQQQLRWFTTTLLLIKIPQRVYATWIQSNKKAIKRPCRKTKTNFKVGQQFGLPGHDATPRDFRSRHDENFFCGFSRLVFNYFRISFVPQAVAMGWNLCINPFRTWAVKCFTIGWHRRGAGYVTLGWGFFPIALLLWENRFFVRSTWCACI